MQKIMTNAFLPKKYFSGKIKHNFRIRTAILRHALFRPENQNNLCKEIFVSDLTKSTSEKQSEQMY